MNSSGIKRGLAASAVSALAVAGIPALATSADAAAGDVMSVAFTGPALNGGNEGAAVVLKTKNVVPTDLDLAGADLGGTTENNATQSVEFVGVPTLVLNGAADDSNPTDGFDEITARIKVTTPAAGGTATFTIFDDYAPANGEVNASEARQPLSIQTAGQVAQIAVAPSTQTSAAGVASAPYTVTLKDSAGRTTQLNTGQSIAVTTTPGAVTSESGAVITAAEISGGTRSFNATGAAINVYSIDLNTVGVAPAVAGHATLDVVKSATVTAPEVDIVTGADSWNGFGDDALGTTTAVRVDQSAIRIDIRSTDAAADGGGTVVLNVNGNGQITFGGKNTTTVSTVLNAAGVGSLTITPDAGSVQENETISVTGGITQNFQFVRSTPTAIRPAADAYVSAIDGTVSVTATIVDQFGLPVTSGDIAAARAGGPNPDATAQRKTVNASGQATFSFTDVNAVPGQTDTVNFSYFDDQFDNSGSFPASTVIRYTTDGKGADFTTRLEGVTASGAGYDPATNRIVPLADSAVTDANEAATLEVVNAEPSTEITVSVDNGALILEPGETRLSQGSASVTDKVTVAGALPAGYQVIGTKAGLTTVTIVNANRTETALFTVTGQSDPFMSRNVTVSGPATSAAGSLATFTAVVTDAFGNPISGVPVSALNVQVTGPGALQDTGAATNATGGVALNVRLQDDAEGPVTIQVTGIPGGAQFGAAANQLTSTSAANSGAGLPVSANSATASVTAVAPPVDVEPVNPQLNVSGKGGGKDKIKAKAIGDAAGARATLWVKGKKVRSGTLNSAGDITFKVRDKNGNKKTKYVVKISGTTMTLGARDSVRVR